MIDATRWFKGHSTDPERLCLNIYVYDVMTRRGLDDTKELPAVWAIIARLFPERGPLMSAFNDHPLTTLDDVNKVIFTWETERIDSMTSEKG